MKTANQINSKDCENRSQGWNASCLVCNQDTHRFGEILIDKAAIIKTNYEEQKGEKVTTYKSRSSSDMMNQFYQNILCSQCEQKFNTKDNQQHIFKRLIGFFENMKGSSREQDTTSISSQQKDQNKLKIKDLIRLVMHMLNEITGIAKIVHQSFDRLVSDQNYSLLQNNLQNLSKLQNFVLSSQSNEDDHDNQNLMERNREYEQERKQSDILLTPESEDEEAEGKGKQFINSFSMESPFSKLPKRQFKQNKGHDELRTANSRLNKREGQETNCQQNKNGFSSSVNYHSMGNNNIDAMQLQQGEEVNHKVNKSLELCELSLLSKQANKSGNIRPNIPQIPSKRIQTVNKSVGNQTQLQQLKQAAMNNTLNISICSNNDFASNSFFTNQSPSMMLMMGGAHSSQNQSVVHNNQPFFDFYSSKNSAQQIIFGDGPASRKLLNIKQVLQKQGSSSATVLQNSLQQEINTTQQQKDKQGKSLIGALQKANLVGRAASQNSQQEKKVERKKNEGVGMIQNIQTVNKYINEPQQSSTNSFKQLVVKGDAKNNQFPNAYSSQSSQNYFTSTNCISQTNKTRSYQGSGLELIQFSDEGTSTVNTNIQSENHASHVQKFESIEKIIHLPQSGSPQTPTNYSNMSNKNRENNEGEYKSLQITQQVKFNAPQPKTLKYKKQTNELNKNNSQSLENKSENGFIESTNITCENEGKINKSGFNQTMRLDQNMSVDNGFMGKSLNNSFNMSCLNKTMCQDSTLSQSTILNNKNASTTPIQEKIIIKSLMKTEYGDTFSSGFHQENTGLLNQAKYIISASWWREWMQFVGFNDISNQMQQDCDTSMKRDRPKKLKNKCLLKVEQLYSFKNTKNVELKENLLEHYDYEAIPKSIFNYIKMWYGVDYEIIRFLKYDPSQPLEKSVYLDLYPEQTLACSLPMGIRKRQKNSTTTVVTSSNSNDRKENQSTLNNTNKTLTTKNSKQDKLNITDQNIQSETQLKSKEGTNESSNNQRVVKRRHHQSLDLDKINITLMDSKTDLNTKQQQENNDNKTIHTQRSIAENKSKACTIF